MKQLRTDANGHELVHHDQRGLRLCEVCNLVMSEGYMLDDGDGYACSDACLVKAEWVIEQPDGLELDPVVTVTPAVLATWAYDVSPYAGTDPDDDELEESQDCPVFWTNWEGDGSPMPEEVADRLMLAPYNLTAEDIHKLGAHD